MSVEKKRVFISSVQKELEIERVAIAGAVSGDEGLSQFYLRLRCEGLKIM
jgi:hypothetical protein